METALFSSALHRAAPDRPHEMDRPIEKEVVYHVILTITDHCNSPKVLVPVLTLKSVNVLKPLYVTLCNHPS